MGPLRLGWVKLGSINLARFARNIVKMRLFEMIFRYSVIYFAALHIEPRVAQQCF